MLFTSSPYVVFKLLRSFVVSARAGRTTGHQLPYKISYIGMYLGPTGFFIRQQLQRPDSTLRSYSNFNLLLLHHNPAYRKPE